MRPPLELKPDFDFAYVSRPLAVGLAAVGLRQSEYADVIESSAREAKLHG